MTFTHPRRPLASRPWLLPILALVLIPLGAYDPNPPDPSVAPASLAPILADDSALLVWVSEPSPDLADAPPSPPDPKARQAQLKRERASLMADLGIPEVSVLTRYENLPMVQIQRPDGKLLARLRASDRVTLHPNLVGRLDVAESSRLINRPAVKQAGLPEGTNVFGMGTSVMVLDSGVDYRLAEFGKCAAPGPQCIVRFARDFTATDDGQPDSGADLHGSHVAAIVHVVALQAGIISADVLYPDGRIVMADVLSAIDWAITHRDEHHIVALNMSFGFPGTQTSKRCDPSPLSGAIWEAYTAGILSVVSSGNDGYLNQVNEPACAPSAISVGAVYDAPGPGSSDCGDGQVETDQVACFSNHAAMLSMLAPGAVITAVGKTKSGTSQAAPHVAGAVALLAGIFPGESAYALKSRLIETGMPIKDHRLPAPNLMMTPRLDVLAAVEGDPNRPRPLPEEDEWWTVPESRRAHPDHAVASAPEPEQPNNLHDAASGITWMKPGLGNLPEGPVTLRRAREACRRLGDPSAPDLSPSDTRGGMTSMFRLPTRGELLSLMDYERVGGPLDAALFGPAGGTYWTISPNARTGAGAQWTVISTRGATASISPHYTSTAQVRCVMRRGSWSPDWPPVRYEPDGNMVRDNATGLTWLRDGANAPSNAHAAAYCAGRADGGQRWRTPTLKELLTLYTRGRRTIIDTEIFGEPHMALSATIALADLDDVPTQDKLYAFNEELGTIHRGIDGGYVRCVQREPDESGDAWDVFQIKTLEHYQRYRARQLKETPTVEILESPLTSVASLDLTEVDGDLNISTNADLVLISLPWLKKVTGNVIIRGNPALLQVRMNQLTHIGGDLIIEKNPSLEASDYHKAAAVSFASLEAVGGNLSISENAALKVVSLPVQRVGDGCVSSGAGMCGDVSVFSNVALTTLSLTGLGFVRGSLRIVANRSLTTTEIRPPLPVEENPVVRIHDTFEVTGNTQLCARSKVDPIMETWFRKPTLPLPVTINVNGNGLSAECRSQCPDLKHCTLWSLAGGAKP